ncbi:hypothetical protein ACFQ36_02485 [Arthrobacter sp. GCM10027362]|uniref:hypothetical protein n=1 Tax=Arthrobacter sp. GCM10027362 TaxID=3273379 RepID=UPI003626843E
MTRLFDRGDGSFLHPSPSATAEHCIRFWSEIEIPDEIIVQFEKAYLARNRKRFKELYEARMNEIGRQWLAEKPTPKREKDQAGHEAAGVAYLGSRADEVTKAVDAQCPPQLVSYDVRQLVRAAQMAWHRPPQKFGAEEGEKVLEHQVELYDGEMSVRDIYLTYNLHELHRVLEEIKTDNGTDRLVKAIQDMSRGLGRDIREVQGEIYSQREDFGYIP